MPATASPASPSLGSCSLVGSACKPDAALGLSFEVIETRGEWVEVEFRILPRLPLRDVAWELALTGSVSLVEGARSGWVGVGASTGRLTLRVPEDGMHKTAELVVRGIMDGSSRDGARFDEPVVSASMLEWERPEAFLPRVVRRDALTGSSVLAEVVPSSWTASSWAPAFRSGAGGSTEVGARESGAAAGGTAEGGAEDGQFLVTGTFLYEDKAWNWKGWTGEDPLLPIRRADVTVFDEATGALLGLGSTGQDGTFAISCEAAGPVDLAVMCESDTSHDAGFQRIRVTPLSAIDYVLQGPVFPGHDGVSDLDVGTVTSLKMTVAGKEANPFNIFDVSVGAWEWLLGPVDAGFTPNLTDIPAVRSIWPHGPKTFAHSWGAWLGYDDGYDDSVILHELGHVAQFQYSKVNSPGTAHTFGDSDQDPRTSMIEGFATCFTGLVFDHLGRRALYVDSTGGSQVNGVKLRLNIETVAPYANDARGSADEVAVCCALFDLLDDADTLDATPGWDDDAFDGSLLVNGESPITAFWKMFTGPMAAAFLMTHNDTWDGWVELYGSSPETETLRELFAGYGQDFYEDAYEPDGTSSQATLLPLLQGEAWNGPFTLYSPPRAELAPGDGDEDWFAHSLVKGSVVTFETRYPAGAADADTQADTLLELYGPDRSFVAWDEDSGTGRNARVASFVVPETGTWRVRILAQMIDWPLPANTFIRRYGSYEYRARASFENHLPVVAQAPVAQPPSLQVGERTRLTAEAVDEDEGQALAFHWRPMDGGTIHGTGPSVAFAPPAVGEPTTVRVQLAVFDELGAASEAHVVEVLVHPDGGALASR